jgi:acyl-CoA-binding protein
MSDLQTQFEQAAAAAQSLSTKPSNDDLLKLYAFYKQGSQGDVNGKRPGFTDFVGRAKYDAWSKLKGRSQDEAKQGYIDLVEQLKSKG